jgi:hypothetical protein
MTFSMMVLWCIARAGVWFNTFVLLLHYFIIIIIMKSISCICLDDGSCMPVCEGCSSSIIRYADVECESRHKADLVFYGIIVRGKSAGIRVPAGYC